MKHSKRVAIFFSLMPGAGHMYLGLVRQGIQLMLLFFAIIFMSASFEMEFLAVFLPIIWFYSIFDVRLKSLKEDPLIDADLPIFADVASMKHFSNSSLVEKYIAYILIVMGIFSMINNLIIPVLSRYIDYYYIRCFKSLVISIILISIGAFMLKGKKSKIKSGDTLCNQEE
ncbi:hypothetical protein [Clostridium magnum]|uniref:TM2 domain protein n=1 Tax=Clostridium magnum DSM 2767 TaxID=1121326 RepID=A0A161WFS6_9CLOT|nr:hypothetical protein [Clostridium magnum]KZL90535.1 hypothetical protein CLMAG_43070 [Clostridium magnum DSM 2767]SHI04669.1 hypothetical protein SAMN02745944_02228 [Clostridium magnum DSM 2767]